MRAAHLICCLLILQLAAVPSRAGDRPWSVSILSSITTSSKLFTNPNARDEFLRGEYSPIDGVPGLGADVRTEFPSIGLVLGVSVEYLRKHTPGSVPNAPSPIPVEDGYTAVPVELTGYFRIPVGGSAVDFYIGGGMGAYFGERDYRYAGVRAVTLSRKFNTGIHVLSGVEYRLTGSLGLRSELKFRTVELESVQSFPGQATVWNGTTVPLPAEPQPSRIQTDGMNLSLAVVYHFR